jgi:glycosyltransferase involved in cell wall biosynthesis
VPTVSNGYALATEKIPKELVNICCGKKVVGIMGLMKASDIFVMPSRYEGLSIAMIEDMACRLPVVASDAPGLRDYIENGENGLLFPLEDHMALAQHIVLLATNKKLRMKLSLEARKSFEREYDMRKNIASADSLFRHYASRR